MIPLKKIISLTILPFVMLSFSQCSSQKKLQQEAPVQLEEVFCRGWVSGIKEGGSGTDIYIPIESVKGVKIELDSVFFRGKSAKLKPYPNKEFLYMGSFLNNTNKKYDIVMNGDSKQEYGNKMPEKVEKIPFELKPNECVVSYKEGTETKYFKIDNVVEKPIENYPMSPKQ